MAQLHIGMIAKKRTQKAISAALDQLPEELDAVYDDMMNRICDQEKDDVKFAMTILGWITFAKEPLKDVMVQHAVAVSPKSTDIDDDDLIDVEELVSICAGMVTLDRESGIIRLVHYTAQQYLESKLSDAQYNIALACLTYLGFGIFDKPCDNLGAWTNRLHKYPLCGYAARYLGDHTRGEAESNLSTAILETFQTQGKRDSITQFQNENFRISYNMSLLHVTSRYGLSTLCRTLLFGKVGSDGTYIYRQIES
jgi:hypothetical protein